MYIRAEVINQTEGYSLGESSIYEAFTDDRAKLFQRLQKEYGSCTSRVYVDDAKGNAVPIGWHFQKRVKYTDCDETFLQGAWVELHVSAPTTLHVRREYLCNLDTGRAHKRTSRRISRNGS